MTLRVTIGVHANGNARRLDATRVSLAACGHEVVTLLARERPAAFNELAQRDDADVIVFVESGVVFSSDALPRLLAALGERRGLAGPSTNRAWNEQRVFPEATENDVASCAREAASRFGDSVRTLAPLYSLGDFCLAVRREVIAEAGLADEAYGLGPCWEMDLNVRAARKGWEGVWVGGAYVYRALPTPQRIAEERHYFQRSRELYQDRFCGARLRGEKHDYRQHCRGDDCPNFAPLAKPEPPHVEVVHESPLVTCIMPTRDRRLFAANAIRLFLRQDYANRELLVVDDGADSIVDLIPHDDRIRYVRGERALPIGAKRNLACDAARGELIAHWDDDDWYPSWRIGEQVRALTGARADVCGTSRLYFHDAAAARAWEYRYPASTGWLAGTTLVYRKAFWERNRFIEKSNGEDSAFVLAHVPKVLRDLNDPRLCVAALHGRNTATRAEGRLWHRCAVEIVRAVMAEDDPLAALGETPLVSCVMPTSNRRRFIAHALRCFREQTWPNRELIVVDDGEDSIEDAVASEPNVRYLRLAQRTSLGAKRAFGASHARGEIVAQWDDDDWYAPTRIAEQIAPIVAGTADLTGYASTIVLETATRRFWSLQPRLHASVFRGDVPAGTLVFRTSILARGVTYPEIDVAEDAGFLERACASGFRLGRVRNDGSFVYVRHGHNTWSVFTPGRFVDPAQWREAAKPAGMPMETVALLSAASA